MSYSRLVNKNTDQSPGIHHMFDANLAKKIVKGKVILDIGCWTGQFLSLIEKNSKTFGVDVSKQAIAFAQKYRKGTYKAASALKLPFKKSFFDCVTMWDVIEHLPQNSEAKAIKEVARVLKPKGYFILSTVTTHPLAILLDPAFFLLGHRHYSEKFLRNLFTQQAFSIKKVIYAGGIYTLLEENWNLIQKHVLKREIKIPFLLNGMQEEYDKKKGFVQIHIIAQKLK